MVFAPPNFDRARVMGLCAAMPAKSKAKGGKKAPLRNSPSEERLQIIECSQFIDVSLWPLKSREGERGANTNCRAQTTTRPRWPTTSYENGPSFLGQKGRKEGRRAHAAAHEMDGCGVSGAKKAGGWRRGERRERA